LPHPTDAKDKHTTMIRSRGV